MLICQNVCVHDQTKFGNSWPRLPERNGCDKQITGVIVVNALTKLKLIWWTKQLKSIGGFRSQPFTTLPWVLGSDKGACCTILLHSLYMNRRESYSRVNEGLTVGSCNINLLLLAEDLVLLASSELGLQHEFNLFSTACNKAGKSEWRERVM